MVVLDAQIQRMRIPSADGQVVLAQFDGVIEDCPIGIEPTLIRNRRIRAVVDAVLHFRNTVYTGCGRPGKGQLILDGKRRRLAAAVALAATVLNRHRRCAGRCIVGHLHPVGIDFTRNVVLGIPHFDGEADLSSPEGSCCSARCR